MIKLLDREKEVDDMTKSSTIHGSQLKTLHPLLLVLLPVVAAVASFITISLNRTFLCPSSVGDPKLAARVADYATTPTQMLAILHYVTRQRGTSGSRRGRRYAWRLTFWKPWRHATSLCTRRRQGLAHVDLPQPRRQHPLPQGGLGLAQGRPSTSSCFTALADGL